MSKYLQTLHVLVGDGVVPNLLIFLPIDADSPALPNWEVVEGHMVVSLKFSMSRSMILSALSKLDFSFESSSWSLLQDSRSLFHIPKTGLFVKSGGL